MRLIEAGGELLCNAVWHRWVSARGSSAERRRRPRAPLGVIGSVQLPMVVMLWGAGLGWYAGNVDSASAATPPPADLLRALPDVPEVSDPLVMNRNLKIALEAASEVVSGRWNPAPDDTEAADITESVMNRLERAHVADPVKHNPDAERARLAAAVLALARASAPSEAGAQTDTVARSTLAAVANSSTPTRDEPKQSGAAPEPAGMRRGIALDDASTVSRMSPSSMNIVPSRRVRHSDADDRHESIKRLARELMANDELDPRDAAEQAYGLLLEGLETLPRDDRRYLGMLAVAALGSGKHREAAFAYRHLIERDPSNARWWTGLAIVEEQLGRPDASREAFAQVARLSGLDSALGRYARQRAAPPGLG